MAKNNNDLWVSDEFGGACSLLVLDEGGTETDSSTEALFRDTLYRVYNCAMTGMSELGHRGLKRS